ncbi:MAG: hypothetical protein SNJ75_10355 [Gemmataceae bacterium]
MVRRRPVRREIDFSFDSFLDVVANVIGILLRFILIAWIAGKSYYVLLPSLEPPPASPPITTPLYPEPSDPREANWLSLRQKIEAYKQEAERAERERSKQQLEHHGLQAKFEQLQAQREELSLARVATSIETLRKARETEKQLLTLLDQQESLRRELQQLYLARPTAKPLLYQAPVAAEVQTEEVMFECRTGRVTLIDTASLLLKAQAAARERLRELEHAWEFTGLSQPVGAFRLRFVVQRQRELFDTRTTPSGGSFRYSFSRWELVPERSQRGESLEEALREGSMFNRIIEQLDPEQVVVTFWVYPDSFPLYRKLRDQLYKRKFVVAGRPLPMDQAIAASRQGSRSRGQ